MRYGLVIYERYSAVQVRKRFDERADLDLITFGLERLKMFAEETGYIIHVEYPGISDGELTREEVRPILDALPDNVHVWEK